MSDLYEKYISLPVNSSLLGLETRKISTPYFCYPTNAHVIGFEECILYCFIDGYDDMVFACNPESCSDSYVYPLAASFRDFLSLILACGTTNPIEQIVWMTKEQFEQHLQNEKEIQTAEQTQLLTFLRHALSLAPMENPYEYVKFVQSQFDGSKIKFHRDYYATFFQSES